MVIGPNSDQVEVLLDNYNGIPSDQVTPLRGNSEKLAPKGTKVLYAIVCNLAENFPALEFVPKEVLFTESKGARKNGFAVEYFNNPDLSGEPVATELVEKNRCQLAGRRPSAESYSGIIPCTVDF